MGRLDLKLKTFLCGKKTIAPQDAERNGSANPPTFNFCQGIKKTHCCLMREEGLVIR